MQNSRPWQLPYSRLLRFWHWATFLVVLLLLFTVFTGKYFVDSDSTGRLLQAEAKQQGIVLAPGVAQRLAHPIEEPVWELHTVLGYVLTGLFLLRIVAEFTERSPQRLSTRIRLLLTLRGSNPEARRTLRVQYIYVLFYALLAGIAGTGLWLAFNEDNRDFAQVHDVKEWHEKGFWALLLFIAIHLAGVLRAERRARPGVVSSMINGK
ncbi:MAG: cytochrome b/b6 domain-containing protein [Chitinophagaceae bacterium]|nr:MAG: cytochrome b/b6 domain-containing protein [Chitinophagaceae bacterium]